MRFKVAVAAGLIAAAWCVPAHSADLGGDCCADLEERVAELEATTARKGNRKMSLTISGQVNTALMHWNDGNNSDVYGVDNAVSRTGFQFDGSAKINPNLTAGFSMVIGTELGSRTHQVTQDYGTAGDDGSSASGFYGGGDHHIAVELAFWYLDSKTLGKVSFGRINGASASSTTVDLGGAGVVANANIGLWQRSFFLTQGAANPATITWSNLMGGNILDNSGQNRSNGIRYDTPTFAGFVASASWGENDMWDAALRYAGEFSGFRIAAAVSYSKNACGSNDCNDTSPFTSVLATQEKDGSINKVQGSASIRHVSSGLFITGAYAKVSFDCDGPIANCPGTANTFTAGGLVAGEQRPDATLLYLQGGITKNWFGLGNTTLYGEWSKVKHGADGLTLGGDSVFDSEVKMYGLGVVQGIDAAAMELYVSYRKYSADFSSSAGAPFGVGGNINDFDVVMGGARVKF